jgi:hypothetical protein
VSEQMSQDVLYLYSSCPSSWANFSSGKVSFHYTLFFWADFSSRVFQYLSNGSLASRIFSASKKAHLGGHNYIQRSGNLHDNKLVPHNYYNVIQ